MFGEGTMEKGVPPSYSASTPISVLPTSTSLTTKRSKQCRCSKSTLVAQERSITELG